MYLLRHHVIPTAPTTKQQMKARYKALKRFGRELGIVIDQYRRSYFGRNGADGEESQSDDDSLNSGSDGHASDGASDGASVGASDDENFEGV